MKLVVTRRGALSRLVAAALPAGLACPSQGSDDFGPVQPPQAAPSTRLIGSDGRAVALDGLLRGRVTAVQLMFTGCSSTCPIQGALFAAAQARLKGEDGELRLLSLSIDPLGDTPATLRTWLDRYEAAPARWTAAVIAAADRDRLLDFLRSRPGGLDSHAARVYVFDRDARLSYRTTELPTAERIVSRLKRRAGA